MSYPQSSNLNSTKEDVLIHNAYIKFENTTADVRCRKITLDNELEVFIYLANETVNTINKEINKTRFITIEQKYLDDHSVEIYKKATVELNK